jgi:MFS family permease
VLADRLSSSRQFPFLLGLILLLLSTILLAIGNSLPVLWLARFLQGASGGIVWTIGTALLIETVGQANLGKTIGTIFSFCSIAGLFSPVVGGILYAKTGYVGVFSVGLALIVVDFIMRVLVIEKKVAAKYAPLSSRSPSPDTPESYTTANESTPLLLDGAPPECQTQSRYRLPEPKSRITQTFPILLVLRDPALLTALFMGFIQAFLLGAFDATVPVLAAHDYHFDSLKAGLLLLPLGLADFFLGPVFGWCVDRWGTKPLSVFGFAYLVPVLVLLRLPSALASDVDMKGQIALYASLLAFNGVGLAVINSTSIVESGNVLERYWKANRALFEGQAPYAQLYGLNSMMWSAGLTVGPVVAGALKEGIGYGDMNAVLAGICAVTAILAGCFVSGRDGDGDGEGGGDAEG